MHSPWHASGCDGSGQLQSPGHTSSSHAGPPHPCAHLHLLGATQRPCPLHWLTLEQSAASHASPKKCSSHSHVAGAVHTPWPLQLAVQTGSPHVAPVHPAAQTHAPQMYEPFYNGALLAYNLGEFQEAFERAQKARDAFPDHTDTLELLGQLNQQLRL